MHDDNDDNIAGSAPSSSRATWMSVLSNLISHVTTMTLLPEQVYHDRGEPPQRRAQALPAGVRQKGPGAVPTVARLTLETLVSSASSSTHLNASLICLRSSPGPHLTPSLILSPAQNLILTLNLCMPGAGPADGPGASRRGAAARAGCRAGSSARRHDGAARGAEGPAGGTGSGIGFMLG